MQKNRVIIHSLLVLSVVILLVFSGCGKKGLPVAPVIKGQSITAPFDLKYKSFDEKIILSWKHEIDKETAVVKPDGFEIFMAKKTFEACEGCPFVFEMVGFVSMPSKEFVTPIEKGYKYYFRIQATNDENMRSEYSKTIQFEYK